MGVFLIVEGIGFIIDVEQLANEYGDHPLKLFLSTDPMEKMEGIIAGVSYKTMKL